MVMLRRKTVKPQRPILPSTRCRCAYYCPARETSPLPPLSALSLLLHACRPQADLPIAQFCAQIHGVAAADLKRLKDAGIATVEGVMHMPNREFATIKGLSAEKVEKLKAAGTC